MALKGNLLYNGDFETGTTEGWVNGAYGLVGQLNFSASAEAKLIGNYGGLLETTEDYKSSYIAYDKVCSFEEYEGYLFIMYGKIVSGLGIQGQLYGLDDKGNLKQIYGIGYNTEAGEWRKFTAILRGYDDATHFSVGALLWGGSGGCKFYIDEAKLIPLKSVKSYNLSEYWSFSNVTSTFSKYTTLGGMGEFKLKSIIQIDGVSGSSPTLDIRLIVAQLEDIGVTMEYNHSQFTNIGVERIEHTVENVGYVNVRYEVGGTDPSFSFRHVIILKPQ